MNEKIRNELEKLGIFEMHFSLFFCLDDKNKIEMLRLIDLAYLTVIGSY